MYPDTGLVGSRPTKAQTRVQAFPVTVVGEPFFYQEGEYEIFFYDKQEKLLAVGGIRLQVR